jgi:hypothetical protein
LVPRLAISPTRMPQLRARRGLAHRRAKIYLAVLASVLIASLPMEEAGSPVGVIGESGSRPGPWLTSHNRCLTGGPKRFTLITGRVTSFGTAEKAPRKGGSVAWRRFGARPRRLPRRPHLPYAGEQRRTEWESS